MLIISILQLGGRSGDGGPGLLFLAKGHNENCIGELEGSAEVLNALIAPLDRAVTEE